MSEGHEENHRYAKHIKKRPVHRQDAWVTLIRDRGRDRGRDAILVKNLIENCGSCQNHWNMIDLFEDI